MKNHSPIKTFKFNQMDNISFYNELVKITEEKKPFSFIRLGDGEGAMLDFGKDSSFFDINYLEQHFGGKCSINEAYEIKNNLQLAIKNADFIGMRDYINNVAFSMSNYVNEDDFLVNFRRAFAHKDARTLNYADARRMAMLHKNIPTLSENSSARFVCHQIGWDLHSSGALPYIISKQKKVAVITSRQGLSGVIEDAFNIEVKQYTIPDKHELLGKGGKRHYPHAYESLLKEIRVEFAGMIFLVAGGIIGKGYASLIKEKGGIALDLGGVVDAWLGILSRPRPLQARYTLKKQWSLVLKKKVVPVPVSSFKVPEELVLNKENVKNLIKKWQARSQY